MKKLVLLTAALLLFPTLCLAQSQIQGLFSLENTAWSLSSSSEYTLGFAGGTIYLCDSTQCLPSPNSVIMDILVISIFSSELGEGYSINGVASSLFGVGMVEVCAGYECATDMMSKTSDSFSPSSLSFGSNQLEEEKEMIDGVLPLINSQ